VPGCDNGKPAPRPSLIQIRILTRRRNSHNPTSNYRPRRQSSGAASYLPRADILTARFADLAKTYSKDNPPTLDEVNRSYRAIVSEELSDCYRRATSNAYAVLVLSDSTDVAQYISKIIAALAKEQEIFMNMGDPETRANANANVEIFRRTIEVESRNLLTYALLNLGVRAYASEHDHPLGRLDIFHP
jgi:hypothetical protein